MQWSICMTCTVSTAACRAERFASRPLQHAWHACHEARDVSMLSHDGTGREESVKGAWGVVLRMGGHASLPENLRGHAPPPENLRGHAPAKNFEGLLLGNGEAWSRKTYLTWISEQNCCVRPYEINCVFGVSRPTVWKLPTVKFSFIHMLVHYVHVHAYECTDWRSTTVHVVHVHLLVHDVLEDLVKLVRTWVDLLDRLRQSPRRTGTWSHTHHRPCTTCQLRIRHD